VGQHSPDDPERPPFTGVDGGPTMAFPPSTPDSPTVAEPVTDPPTGPIAAPWALEDLMQPAPAVPPEPPPAPQPPARTPGFYVSLTAAVMLTLGLVGALVVLTVNRPVTSVAGAATGVHIPSLPPPTHSTAPDASAPSSTVPPASDLLAGLADHPLSTSTATMAPFACALPRFDPADAAQARFYGAAKVCADTGFGGLLPASGLPAPNIAVVSVQNGPKGTPCGAVAPTDPATQCQGTVYMTPARLRDVEGLDRYPGKYFGVFLREYAEAVLYATGLTELYDTAAKSPDAPGDLADRLAQQATCLAGVASGAMAGLGAVDSNITNEIRERLTTTDAPPDADAWLQKGAGSREPSSCDTWA
jgi:hypothetical protein